MINISLNKKEKDLNVEHATVIKGSINKVSQHELLLYSPSRLPHETIKRHYIKRALLIYISDFLTEVYISSGVAEIFLLFHNNKERTRKSKYS